MHPRALPIPDPLVRARLFLLLVLVPVFGNSRRSGTFWRDDYEQQQQQQQQNDPDGIVQTSLRYRRPSFYAADAYRLHCHSCMSPYLEDQFQFISHLYRRPLVFSDKCDHGAFDWRYIASKNCSDACVTLRMNDRVGGRRRFGYMRGCLSDIIHHNRTAVRFSELSRTTKSGATVCTAIRLRDLFVSSDRYAFEPNDHIELCACIRPNCNSARLIAVPQPALLALATILFFALSMMWPDAAICSAKKGIEEAVAEYAKILGARIEDQRDAREEPSNAEKRFERERRRRQDNG